MQSLDKVLLRSEPRERINASWINGMLVTKTKLHEVSYFYVINS
jgi:hypothetical protein